MKKILVAAASVALLSSSAALADLPSKAPAAAQKLRAHAAPEKKIKRLPKSVVPGQEAGTQTGGDTQQQQDTPAPGIQIGDIAFTAVSPTMPACQKKWIVQLTNAGSADTGSLVMAALYRGAQETAAPEIPLDPIPAGVTVGHNGYMPLREHQETEVVVNIKDGATVLASKVFPLPPGVKASAGNIGLADATFTASGLSFVIENKGNVDVNAMSYVLKGIANASEEYIMAGTIPCLSAGASLSVDAPFSGTQHQSYVLRVMPSLSSEVVAEKTYTR